MRPCCCRLRRSAADDRSRSILAMSAASRSVSVRRALRRPISSIACQTAVSSAAVQDSEGATDWVVEAANQLGEAPDIVCAGRGVDLWHARTPREKQALAFVRSTAVAIRPGAAAAAGALEQRRATGRKPFVACARAGDDLVAASLAFAGVTCARRLVDALASGVGRCRQAAVRATTFGAVALLPRIDHPVAARAADSIFVAALARAVRVFVFQAAGWAAAIARNACVLRSDDAASCTPHRVTGVRRDGAYVRAHADLGVRAGLRRVAVLSGFQDGIAARRLTVGIGGGMRSLRTAAVAGERVADLHRGAMHLASFTDELITRAAAAAAAAIGTCSPPAAGHTDVAKLAAVDAAVATARSLAWTRIFICCARDVCCDVPAAGGALACGGGGVRARKHPRSALVPVEQRFVVSMAPDQPEHRPELHQRGNPTHATSARCTGRRNQHIARTGGHRSRHTTADASGRLRSRKIIRQARLRAYAPHLVLGEARNATSSAGRAIARIDLRRPK